MTNIVTYMPLITVLTGAIAAFIFQQRQSNIRRSIDIREKRIAISRDIFDELSRLMDRRLYCTVQLYIWIQSSDETMKNSTLLNYREAVRDWNYSTNRHVAMLHTFFGEEIRTNFREIVSRGFVRLGSLVESFHRGEREENLQSEIKRGTEDLYHAVSNINAAMLEMIFEQESFAGFRNDRPTIQRTTGAAPNVAELLSVKPNFAHMSREETPD